MTSATSPIFDFVNVWEGVDLIYQAEVETKYCQNLNPPLGPKGNKGEKGVAGVKGNKGESGKDGVKGNKGVSGMDAQKGSKGVKGTSGNKGKKGISAQKGNKGLSGPNAPPSVSIVTSIAKKSVSEGEKKPKNGSNGERSQYYSQNNQKQSTQYTLQVGDVSNFAVGEAIYVSGGGFFKVKSISPQQEKLTVSLLDKHITDSGNIPQGASLIGSGLPGKRGNNARANSIIQSVIGNGSQSPVTVEIRDSQFYSPSGIIFVDNTGYFSISSTPNVKQFVLTLLQKNKGQTGVVNAGSRIIASGARGPQANNNSFNLKKKEQKIGRVESKEKNSSNLMRESFFLIESPFLKSLFPQKEQLPLHLLSSLFSISLEGREISSPLLF